MKRFLLWAFVCLSMVAHASVTITASLKDLTGTAVTSGMTARLTLKGCSSNLARVIGTGIVPAVDQDFTPNSTTGVVTMTIYPNSDITCGTTTGGTSYDFAVLQYGTVIRRANYVFNSSGDISNMNATTSVPVVAAPTGDNTYCRLDGGNCGFTGPITVKALNSWRFADRYSSIQAAVDDCQANACGEVLVPPGTYDISSTITNHVDNIKLRCLGSGGGALGVGPIVANGSCILNWTGSAGGTIADWSEAATGTNVIGGGGIEGFEFKCNNSAAVGLHVANIWHGNFRNNYFEECTTAGLRVDTLPLTAANRSTQFNTFDNLSFKQILSTGKCIWDGSPTDAVADSAFNLFSNIRSAAYLNGDCIYIDNADGEKFFNVAVTRNPGGTGKGVHLTGATIDTSARQITFVGLDATAGGLVQDGAATGNTVRDYNTANGAPQLIASSITNGTLLWNEIGFGNTSNFYGLIQGNNPSYTGNNVANFDTISASPSVNSYVSWSAASVPKWTLGRINSSNDFSLYDVIGSINRIFLTGGANSSTTLNSTGNAAVSFNTTANSGTGGVNFGSGGASPSTVASVSNTGKGTFNGGVQPASTGTAITWFQKATHASLDLASVASGACTAETTETITGAALGDSCNVSAGTALEAGGFFRCAVTATDTAKWQFCNLSGSPIDRASDTYTIRDSR